MRRRWYLIAITLLLFASVCVSVFFKSEPTTTTKAGAPVGRDPLLWPFASDSIWNMPVGANAKYVDASIGSRGFGTDTDWFITTKASDPLVPTYAPPTFGAGRCAGTAPQQQAQWHLEAAQPLHVPSNLIIADAINANGIYSTPNNSSAFLEPDGKTLVSFNVTTRCKAGDPLYGNWFGQSNLYGDGISGGHGGSALSSIGGSIRVGELLNDQPIRHALKIDIWGNWMHYDAVNGGHRWPAPLADGGAPNQYKGNNPALVMGSLLTLPTNATPESLGLTSPIGKKVFQALQNYGAYVVDDTGGDYNALCVEQQAQVEYKNTTGHAIEQDQPLITDFNKMIANVKVIDNNSPTSIGGGGTPRVSLAPPFATGTTLTTTATTTTSVPTVTATSTTSVPTVTATIPSTPVTSKTSLRNNIGISTGNNHSTANYDGGGFSYAAETLSKAGFAPGKTVHSNGFTFTWPKGNAGTSDNYQVLAQTPSSALSQITIPVSPVTKATMLAFLGSATNGPTQGNTVITYSDGTRQTVKVGFSDWTLNGGKAISPTYNNKIAVSLPYRNKQVGSERVTTYVFSVAVALSPGKTVVSVTLPTIVSQGALHVFAVGTK